MSTICGRAHFTRIRGYSIVCSAGGCRQETAEQAPSRFVRTAELAVRTAELLGWVHAQRGTGEPAVWFCPLHQTFDETARAWVPSEPVKGRS